MDERQRAREPESQRAREPESQRARETESQRDGEAERQRGREGRIRVNKEAPGFRPDPRCHTMPSQSRNKASKYVGGLLGELYLPGPTMHSSA
jgi:hypothetical protein